MEISITKESFKQYKYLTINFDEISFERIEVIREGKKVTFPLWEFWQILEKHYDYEVENE